MMNEELFIEAHVTLKEFSISVHYFKSLIKAEKITEVHIGSRGFISTNKEILLFNASFYCMHVHACV